MRTFITTAMLGAALALGEVARAQDPLDWRGGAGAAPTPAAVSDLPDTVRAQVERAIERVYPALVRIHVVAYDYAGGREQKFEGSGSGAIVTAEGHVITNHHVAGKAKRIRVTLATKEEVEAELVGTDALADIAIVKLDLKGRKDPFQPIPVAVFGDSDALRVGDRVLAMGSPLALSQSVTMGIVANLDMMLPRFVTMFGGFTLDGEDVGSLVKWIGHDAQIFPGNSGGPLVNLRGEIVGINEIGFGLSGAIPGNLAKRVAAEIYRHGEVRRSYTGLELQPLLKSSGRERGVLVSGVVEGSPAAKAGIKPGDVLVAWDGQPVSVRFLEQLPPLTRAMLETPVGKTVEVAVLRPAGLTAGEQPLTFSLTTEPRPRAQGREAELKAWGATARELTAFAARELKRPSRRGALVTSVRPGGPASEAKPPIVAGDVVTEVGGEKVGGLDDLLARTEEALRGKSEPVATLVTFERRGERLATVVKLGPQPPDEKTTEARKAWFPAGTQVLTAPLAEALGLAGKTGVIVTQVYPVVAPPAGEASPTSTAGGSALEVGDIILAMDGDPIPASQPEDIQVFPHMVRQRKIGAVVELTVVRAGKEMKLAVKLLARPPEGRELAEYKDEAFEFTAREISFQDRLDHQWKPDVAGAVVSSVESGGWAALAGLKGGDLVIAVDGKPVGNVAAMKAAMEEVARRRAPHVTVQVRRGVHTMFVELEPAWRSE